MKEALARAQSLYKRQKYRLALEILESNAQSDLLVKLSTTEQLIALDLLASLCEKQGYLNRARKYAVRMIRLKESDPRGYMRLGKLLQLIPEKAGEAKQIYQRAFLKVSPLSPELREFMKRQVAACAVRQKSLNAQQWKCTQAQMAKCDPMLQLPHELLVAIFRQLSLRQRVRCTLVSKSWYQFLVTEPSFWSDLEFDAAAAGAALPQLAAATSSNVSTLLGPSKYVIVAPETVNRYCNRSSQGSLLRLDLQKVLVKDPKSMFRSLLASAAHASRIAILKFDSTAPVTDPPVVSMIRHALPSSSLLNPMPYLRELRISTDSPEKDIRWCLEHLPSLEVLDLVTAPRPKSENLVASATAAALNIRCPKLHTVSIIGRSGLRIISDSLASQLASIQSLERLDLHRVVPMFWPTMHSAIANPRLKRMGFTSEGIHGKDLCTPLAKFAGDLSSITLNDLKFSCVSAAPLLPDGTRYTGGSRTATQSLTYVELKRVTLLEFNLAELINSWGCASSLTTLVVHALHTQSYSRYPLPDDMTFEKLPMLDTLQFTGMGNISEDFFEWLINACPQLRKVNLDGTIITGPKLVKLIQNKPSLQFIRCRNAVDLSADTIAWIRSMRHINVSF